MAQEGHDIPREDRAGRDLRESLGQYLVKRGPCATTGIRNYFNGTQFFLFL